MLASINFSTVLPVVMETAKFLKIFEMPILGYTSYLPFVCELFAMYQFILLLLRQREDFLGI